MVLETLGGAQATGVFAGTVAAHRLPYQTTREAGMTTATVTINNVTGGAWLFLKTAVHSNASDMTFCCCQSHGDGVAELNTC